MQETIILLINKYGYFGIMSLIAIENIFPPIPSEIILTFAGFATTKTNLSIIGVIIFSTIGSLIGALMLYYIGRILNEERLIKLVSGKAGKILKLTPADIEKASLWFRQKGVKTVFICRFIPILRSIISIPAGSNKMNLNKFIIYTTLGTLIWNTVLVIIGSIVGEKWEDIVNIMDKYSNITLIVLIIIAIIVIIKFYRNKKVENNQIMVDNRK